jgi:lysophospholipase L1-like esterase
VNERPAWFVVALAIGLVILIAALAVVGIRALGIGEPGPPVALIGDSITANLQKEAKRRLGDDYALTVDGRPGYLAGEQLPAVENAARFPFDQVVINLGTNDVMTSDHDLDETVASLDQAVTAVAGIRCVHLVTVSEGMINETDDAGPRARRVNQAIREIAARHPNVRVIDWAAIERQEQADRGEPITTDTVHPTDVGNRVLADAYGESLAACAG